MFITFFLLRQPYSEVESPESINVHPALTRQVLLSNIEQCWKNLLRSPQASTAVSAFGLPRGGVLSIPSVFLVKCSEMPYDVLEIL